MTVPEAAVDKDHRFPARKYYVRSAGQMFAMKPETVAQGVSKSPHSQLGFCIFTPN